MKNKIYNNLNIENLMKTEWINQFDEKQIWQIEMGITRSKVDVSIYAKPEFDWQQMDVIKAALINKVDVSWYAKKEFSYEQMRELQIALIEGMDVSGYAKPEISSGLMFDRRKLPKLKKNS